jgi:cholesterol transport system auxiliary component
MSSPSFARVGRLAAAALLCVLAGGCSALRPNAASPPAFYALDSVPSAPPVAARAAAMAPKTAPTLIVPTLLVNAPHAASGFDSQRIVYVREAHRLEYYARSEWVDTPARMLAPLIVAALENSGSFRAVVLTPSAATGDLRLDTEIIRLQHELGSQPSRERFTLRAYLVDNTTRRVLASREFDESVAVASEDPYGAIMAANRAVQTVLGQLADFCREASMPWPASVTSR